MKKQEEIELKKSKPFEIGDKVYLNVPYIKLVTKKEKVNKRNTFVEHKEELVFNLIGTISKLDGSFIHLNVQPISIPDELRNIVETYYNRTEKFVKAPLEYITPTFFECGANPFAKERLRIDFYNQDISSLLYKLGWDNASAKTNLNPTVIDANGKTIYYQRPLVWTLGEKQLLLDSIYNNIEIGKFLFRYNDWDRIEKLKVELGGEYYYDCIDGKQRLTTILDFVNNKFPDSYNNYWDDLSTIAQRRFLNYSNLSYGQLPESASDKDVINCFLTLNFTGAPMSKEHIEYVKSIKL